MRRGLASPGGAHGDPSPTQTLGTLTCSSTRKMYQPMISSSAEAAATAAMVPSALGGWLRACAAEGCGFAEGRWSLGVRCWAHCCSRRGRALSTHPPPNCACAHGGGSIRRGSRGHSSFVRRGKKIIHLLFPPTPASRVSSYPFPEYSAVPAFEF